MEIARDDLVALVRRRAAAVARPSEPVTSRQLVAFQLRWQRIPAGTGTGPDATLAAIAGLEGAVLPAAIVEGDLLAGRVGDYEPRWLDDLCSSGELTWVGAGVGRVVFARREVAGALLGALGLSGQPDPALDGPLHTTIREVLGREGSSWFRDLAGVRYSDEEVLAALWDLVWAGEVTCDGFASLRAATGRGLRGALAGGRGASGLPGARLRARPRPGSLRAGGPAAGQGRWSLVARLLPGAIAPASIAAGVTAPASTAAGVTPSGVTADDPAAADDDPAAGLALADALLQRYGVVTRDAVRGEAVPGGFGRILPALEALEAGGLAVAGVFVAGAGEPQFALPEALRLLDVGPAMGGACIVSAADPANAYGAAVPWPVDGPSRVAGSHVVFLDGVGSLYLEKDGRGLRALRPLDGTWEGAAVAALAGAVRAGRWRRLALAAYPEETAPLLTDAGFVPTPKGLVLYG